MTALHPPHPAATVIGIGRVLGDRYEIRAHLGAGGMGEVWLAHDLKLRVEVALKSVRLRFSGQERWRDLLRREVRAAREVVSPNVCRVFDLVSEDGLELVSMEFVDGATLAEVLRERSPLPLGEAHTLASQLLAGLEAVHEAGLVHRDLKPENVMITRTGRVVVMDLGLAKPPTTSAGSIAGTPGYMAPEQAQGGPVDARTDVFAAGVVLAEMVAPAGTRDKDRRLTLWEGIRQAPPEVPDGPWAEVIARAVSASPAHRFGSARELARALERVTVHAERGEGEEPYPGLRAFTARDRERFFGREAEVEQLLRKLGRPRLLAIAGPSGAGKTSFLQAGLVPALPEGFRHLVVHPGDRPLATLARALVPEIAGDTEAMRELVGVEDLEALVTALSRWRRRHDQAVLIVDQLEELFTQNPVDVQGRLAELLGRLPIEGNIHVILSLRDDFLFRCHEHQALAPVFAELTPLGPPAGAALRRALVQPAAALGYRFEDDALVDTMLAEVEHERGALPLLAFAASRLWEKRDRERGLLTRAAFEEIGGVAGALAQHAEATLDHVGPPRTPIVREIFRNLVTAERTRVARDREELLSVFTGSAGESARASSGLPPEEASTSGSIRAEASGVLDALVDARLLTSYEVPGEADQPGRSRIEIVHESLLSAWPRLVRWETQDADGAQLREQLRQVARIWDERGRPEDLLWTGSAYREFAVWRERYSGGLTAAEEAFASAASRRAALKRRQRRVVTAAIVAAALGVAAVTSALWQQARVEVRQREAAQLLSLGRLRLEGHPTAALAYAIASLERADNEAARRFAVEALWKGPMAFVVPESRPAAGRLNRGMWSPDGRWLAMSGSAGLVLLDRDSGTSHRLESETLDASFWGFSADGSRVVTQVSGTLQLWSLPGIERLATWPDSRPVGGWLVDRRLVTVELEDPGREDGPRVLRERSIDGGPLRTLGRWPARGAAVIDPSGSWLAAVEEGRLLKWRLDPLGDPPRVLGRHRGEVGIQARPWVDRIVTGDATGEVRVWNASTGRVERTLQSPTDARGIALDPAGRSIAVTSPAGPLSPGSLRVLDLEAPRGAEPRVLLHDELQWFNEMHFHPDGRLLVTGHGSRGVLLWNLSSRHSIVLPGQMGAAAVVAFAPDGRLVSTSDEGVVRLWPLWTDVGSEPQELRSRQRDRNYLGGDIEVAADGRFVAVLQWEAPAQILVLPLDGSPAVVHSPPELSECVVNAVTLAPDGDRAAFECFMVNRPEENWVGILDLRTGGVRRLSVEGLGEACDPGPFQDLVWLSDGRLFSDGTLGLRVWQLDDGSSRQLRPCRVTRSFVAGATPDAGTFLTLYDPRPPPGETATLSAFDVATGLSREITDHGGRLSAFAVDPTSAILVTGDAEGLVRAGPLAGGEPHLLFGHSRAVSGAAVSPDGKWIATVSIDKTVRLWPMPDMSEPPLHTLPHAELLAKLRSLTNLRVVPAPGTTTGYDLEVGPLPRWRSVPTW